LIASVEVALHTSAKKIRITGSYPYFIQQWNQYADALAEQAEGLAVIGDSTMTFALIHDGAVASIRTLTGAGLDQESLQKADSAIHALALQAGVAPPREMLLVGRLHHYRDEVLTKNIRWRQIHPVHSLPAGQPGLKEAA
jgi:hypothetical protein